MEAQNLKTPLSKGSEYLLGVAEVEANSLQHEIFALLSSKYSLNEVKKGIKKTTAVIDSLNSVFCEMGIQNTFLVMRRLVKIIDGIAMHISDKLQKYEIDHTALLRESQFLRMSIKQNSQIKLSDIQEQHMVNYGQTKMNKMRGICLFNQNYKRKLDKEKSQQNKNDNKKEEQIDQVKFKRKLFNQMRKQLQSVQNQLYTPITDQISSFVMFERKFLETFNHFEYSEDLQKMAESLQGSTALTQQFLKKFDLKTQQIASFKTQIQELMTEIRTNTKQRNKTLSSKFQQIMNKFLKKRLEMYKETSMKIDLFYKMKKQQEENRVDVGVQTVVKELASIKNYQRKIINLEEKLKFKQHQKQNYVSNVIQKIETEKNNLELQVSKLKINNSNLMDQVSELKKIRENLYQKLAELERKKQSPRTRTRKQQITIVMKNGVRIGSNFRPDQNSTGQTKDDSPHLIPSKKRVELKRMSSNSHSSKNVINGSEENMDEIRETIGEQSQFFKEGTNSISSESQQENQNQNRRKQPMQNTMISLDQKIQAFDKQKKVRMKKDLELMLTEEVQQQQGGRKTYKKQLKTQKVIRLKTNPSSKSIKNIGTSENKRNFNLTTKQTPKAAFSKQEFANIFRLKNVNSLDRNAEQKKMKQQNGNNDRSGRSSKSYNFEKLSFPNTPTKNNKIENNLGQITQKGSETVLIKADDLKKVGKLSAQRELSKNSNLNKQNSNRSNTIGQSPQKQKQNHQTDTKNPTNPPQAPMPPNPKIHPSSKPTPNSPQNSLEFSEKDRKNYYAKGKKNGNNFQTQSQDNGGLLYSSELGFQRAFSLLVSQGVVKGSFYYGDDGESDEDYISSVQTSPYHIAMKLRRPSTLKPNQSSKLTKQLTHIKSESIEPTSQKPIGISSQSHLPNIELASCHENNLHYNRSLHLPYIHAKKSKAILGSEQIIQEFLSHARKSNIDLSTLKISDYLKILKLQYPQMPLLKQIQNHIKNNVFDALDKNNSGKKIDELNVQDFVKILRYHNGNSDYDDDGENGDGDLLNSYCFKKQRSYSLDNVESLQNSRGLNMKIHSLGKDSYQSAKVSRIGISYNKKIIQKILLQGMMLNRKQQSLPDLSIGNKSTHQRPHLYESHSKVVTKLKKTHRKKQEIQNLLRSAKGMANSDEGREVDLPQIKIKSIFKN